jgi:hypothetical protein
MTTTKRSPWRPHPYLSFVHCSTAGTDYVLHHRPGVMMEAHHRRPPSLRRRQLLLRKNEEDGDEHCNGLALLWRSYDQNEDSEISWVEVKLACAFEEEVVDDDTIRGSIQAFCEDHIIQERPNYQQLQQNDEPPKNATTYLQCTTTDYNDDHLVPRISLEDRVIARAFCEDVLVDLHCSRLLLDVAGNDTDHTDHGSHQEEETTTTTHSPLLSRTPTIATGGLLLAVLILAIVLVGCCWRRVRAKRKPGRSTRRGPTTSTTNDDVEPQHPPPSAADNSSTGRTTEVNDFAPAQDDNEWSTRSSWSSIESGSSSITDGGSSSRVLPIQKGGRRRGLMRTVAQGRIVQGTNNNHRQTNNDTDNDSQENDDNDRTGSIDGFVSLKKLPHHELQAGDEQPLVLQQGTEPTSVYDFASIGGEENISEHASTTTTSEGMKSNNNNTSNSCSLHNATLYFECLPFSSTSTAL